MSEKTATATTTASESITGLAMILGELKAEQRHHIEHTGEAIEDLQTALAEETATRESAIAKTNESVAVLNDAVQHIVHIVEMIVTETQTALKSVVRVTVTPPARKRGENNGDFFKRLSTWAREQGITEPPRPKATEFVTAYDKRIAEWEKANGSD